MKAAILKAWGSPLVVENVSEPVLGTGEVLVDVAAAPVLSYSNEVFSGQRKYLLELPAIPGPGAIGRVRKTGPDATHLQVGDWVWCDPTVRSRDDAPWPDITLQGLTAGNERGLPLQKYHHDGAYAEQVRVPTENVTRIGNIAPKDAAKWCGMGGMLVPFGGWQAIDLRPGETALVSGATGAFGSAAVLTALAMGAGRVVATGRNEKILAALSATLGPRVVTVAMKGDEDADRKRIQAAAETAIDCMLDILPPAANPAQVRAAVMAIRPYGRAVLMGGVGMLGNAGLEVPYPWLMRNCITVRGQWMYPVDGPAKVVRLIRSGLADLGHYRATQFPFEKINEAVVHASKDSGLFRITVVHP